MNAQLQEKIRQLEMEAKARQASQQEAIQLQSSRLETLLQNTLKRVDELEKEKEASKSTEQSKTEPEKSIKPVEKSNPPKSTVPDPKPDETSEATDDEDGAADHMTTPDGKTVPLMIMDVICNCFFPS